MIKLSSGYLYLVCFCGGTNPNTIVMTPTRPINISKDTNNLPASPKAGVRPRLDPTVLKAEVHSKTKANSEACGSSTLRTNTPRKRIIRYITRVALERLIESTESYRRNTSTRLFPRITAKRLNTAAAKAFTLTPPAVDWAAPPINIKSNISNKLCNEKRSNRYS